MADNDADVPPLEDMSELIEQVETIREQRKSHTPQAQYTALGRTGSALHNLQECDGVLQTTTSSDNKVKDQNMQVIENKKPPSTMQKSKNNGATFAGMKKGFLFGGNSRKSTHTTHSPVQTKLQDDGIPFITPMAPDTSKEKYQIPEVQEAMNAGQAFLQNKDWVTEDLLTKILKNPRLSKRLADPTFMAAITEFQNNPTAAMQKYQDNKEMQQFLQEFCGLMGDHFTKLDDTSPPTGGATSIVTSPPGGADIRVHRSTDPKQPTAEDESRIQEILQDPEIRDILMDARVQKMFEDLRQNPLQAQHALRQADPSLQQSIRKLVQCGLLQLERSAFGRGWRQTDDDSTAYSRMTAPSL